MEFKQIEKRALEIRNLYDNSNINSGYKVWTLEQKVQGLVGDVGDLVKLVMAKLNYRSNENIDEKIMHELADCLWAIITISNDLDIDLEKAFTKTMDDLELRISAS